MTAVRSLGDAGWFRLGDGDLALHVLRTARLNDGETLSAITADFARRWGIAAQILPMSDDRVATQIDTAMGRLGFQDYFGRERCTPAVRAIRFEGAEAAAPAGGVLEAIGAPDCRAILVAPSNPFLIRSSPCPACVLRSCRRPPPWWRCPRSSPAAVKGPTAKIMTELCLEVSAAAVAEHYAGIIDGMLVDERDAAEPLGLPIARCDTLMTTLDDRRRVAAAALALADSLR